MTLSLRVFLLRLDLPFFPRFFFLLPNLLFFLGVGFSGSDNSELSELTEEELSKDLSSFKLLNVNSLKFSLVLGICDSNSPFGVYYLLHVNLKMMKTWR